MNIEDILNHPKIEESKEMVNNINGDMIGRIALNQGAQATHVLYIVKELLGANIERHNKHNHPYDLIEGSSYDLSVIENVHSLLDNSIDLLFIDGDHRKAGVIKDFDAYSELVNVGGVVIFDDYWSGDLAKYAWKNKSHWDEPERMDIVGAYAELESRDDFYKKWKSIGLIADKKIIQRIK
jgi:cephalosporin hydroxylase